MLGIVARMQTHRHYEDLFEAFARRAADRARRAALGRNARTVAGARHALPVQAAQVLSRYENVLRREKTA